MTTFSPVTQRRLLLASVLAITFLVYVGTLSFEFVADDTAQILQNPAIRSWRNLPHVFGLSWWSMHAGAVPPYYRPVPTIWFMAVYSLIGVKPMAWHLAAVVWHLVATGLVFYLARRWMADDFAAAIAALLFGVHPIHIECVAWATGANECMMTALCIGSVLAYLRFRDRTAQRWLWFAFSLLLYGLACLVKETSIVLPGLIAIYEWLLEPRTAAALRLRRIATLLATYTAVAIAYLAMRWSALHGSGSTPPPIPAWQMPLSWPELLWFYIHKLVWPTRLALFYHVQFVATPDLRNFWTPLLLVLASTVAVVLVIRRLPSDRGSGLSPRAVGWLAVAWFVLPLLPVLDIFPLQLDELAHDRYLYLPAFGFVLFVALLIRRLDLGKARVLGAPAVQVAASVVIAAGLAFGTAQQSVHWGNNLLLCYRALQIAPNSPTAALGLGDALLARGYTEEGIRIYEQILRRYPRLWWSHFQLGDAYYKVGRYAESEQQMFEAVRLNSATPQLLTYLAVAQMKNRHYEDAERTLRASIAVQPNVAGEYYMLGVTLQQQGRWAEAVSALEQSLKLDPDQPKARAELDDARAHLR
jgi:Flp pilus assembly protein TadD